MGTQKACIFKGFSARPKPLKLIPTPKILMNLGRIWVPNIDFSTFWSLLSTISQYLTEKVLSIMLSLCLVFSAETDAR